MDTKPIKNNLSLIVGLIQGSAERMQDNLDDLRKADGSYAVLAALYGLEARMNTLDYQMMLMRQEVARSRPDSWRYRSGYRYTRRDRTMALLRYDLADPNMHEARGCLANVSKATRNLSDILTNLHDRVWDRNASAFSERVLLNDMAAAIEAVRTEMDQMETIHDNWEEAMDDDG